MLNRCVAEGLSAERIFENIFLIMADERVDFPSHKEMLNCQFRAALEICDLKTLKFAQRDVAKFLGISEKRVQYLVEEETKWRQLYSAIAEDEELQILMTEVLISSRAKVDEKNIKDRLRAFLTKVIRKKILSERGL